MNRIPIDSVLFRMQFTLFVIDNNNNNGYKCACDAPTQSSFVHHYFKQCGLGFCRKTFGILWIENINYDMIILIDIN